MVCGSLFAVFLVRPSEVVRDDGTKVFVGKHAGVLQELRNPHADGLALHARAFRRTDSTIPAGTTLRRTWTGASVFCGECR